MMIKYADFKKFFLFTLIGSLVVSAMVAVVVVLVGKFEEITIRVLSTLAMVLLHSLLSLLFIWEDEKQNSFNKLTFFVNTIFGLIVISFVTSLLSIWKVIPSETTWHLYSTYVLFAISVFHGEVLTKVLSKQTYLDVIIYINFGFIAAVFLLILPLIYLNNPYIVVGDLYIRILSACGIIDGTLSVLTVILYKLYIHNHPEEQSLLNAQLGASPDGGKKGISIWIWILIIYLVFQVITPFIFGTFW